MGAKPLFKNLAYFGLLLVALGGCAVGRSEIDLDVLPAQPTQAKQLATIIEVRDRRIFLLNPRDHSRPSLATETELRDEDLVARTVGRTRNSYGMRIGDVVLPEGQTVSDLAREAVTTALSERGYVVVDSLAPGVIPVSVDIAQFWAWFVPGLFEITLEFDSRLLIYGTGVLDYSPTVVRGRSSTKSGIARKDTWREVIQDGLDNLVLAIKDEIETAEAPRSQATVPDSTTDADQPLPSN